MDEANIETHGYGSRSKKNPVSSKPEWKEQDPQIPQSKWYHTDALYVGLRVIRPLVEPNAKEREAKWDKHLPLQDRKGED